MLPIIPKPAISPRQKGLAIAIAGFADLLQLAVFPAFFAGAAFPIDDALDFLVAVLMIAVCGFKWQFVLGFLLELVPGVALFPTWTAVALMLPTRAGDATYQRLTPAQGRPAYPHVDVQARVVPPVQPPPVQATR